MHAGAPENHQALPPICPEVDAAVPVSQCVSVGVVQNQQSNETYNLRVPLPTRLAVEAQPETRRIRLALEGLSRAQRQVPAAVESALRQAGMLSSGLVAYGPWDHQVTFGGYEPFNTSPAVCAFGEVTPTAVVVSIGGNTREGACYADGGQ